MANESKPQPQAAHNHESAPEQAAVSARLAVIGIVLVLVVTVASGRLRDLQPDAQRSSAGGYDDAAGGAHGDCPAAEAGYLTDTFVLPGNVTAYTDSPIYARTSGYLTRWYFDIGARVKKGQLLCEIASPEVDQQLAQAEADLATAKATANNAHIQADRYSDLVDSNAVSQQDTDTFVNQAAATASSVRSAEANLQRLHELQSFEKVYAPFDGVVTARDCRYGPAHRSGREQRAVSHAGAAGAARIYQRAAGLHGNREARIEARPDLSGTPGQDVPGNAGAHRQSDRSCDAHFAG